MCASQPLDRSHTDACELVDLRVGDALEGHRKSHLLELVRNAAADHAGTNRTMEENGTSVEGVEAFEG